MSERSGYVIYPFNQLFLTTECTAKNPSKGQTAYHALLKVQYTTFRTLIWQQTFVCHVNIQWSIGILSRE